MQQKNFNQRGSTLVMVMIIMMVLTLLGTTILSLAYSNYKMKKINSLDTVTFYLAEAGLEEAYAIIGNMVDHAIEKGNEEVAKVYTEEYIQNYMKYDEDNEKEYIDEERLLVDQNITFKNAYKTYLSEELGKILENMDVYELHTYGEGTPQITIKNDKEKLEFENDKLSISLRSSYTKNHIKKHLDATYEISLPEYQGQYYLTTYVKNIPENVAWMKAMAIDGDLVVKEGEVEIKGDLYVKGKEDSARGIVSMGTGTKLMVKGAVTSQQNIQNRGENTTIQIQGNVYAKSCIIDEKAENAGIIIQPGKERMDGSVYTLDDLELSGRKSHINIAGSYYGISDGSHAATEDQSSSIVINAEDLGEADGSTLSIGKEVFIFGSSFIKLEGDQKYQTGESISIRGNYRAYSYPLLTLGDRGGGKESLHEDNVIFSYYDPLVLASKFKNESPLMLQDKSDYFKFYHQEYERPEENKSSGLHLGRGISLPSVDNNTFIHSGAVVYGGNAIESSDIDIEDEGIRIRKYEEHKNMVYRLGDENMESASVTTQVNFDALPSQEPHGNNNPFILFNPNESKEYAIIGQNGDTSSIPENATKIYLAHPDIKGIIITKGKLYLTGEMNFMGTMIVKDDVIIEDGNAIKVYHDKHYVAKTIDEHLDWLENVFQNDSQNKTIPIVTKAKVDASEDQSLQIRDSLIKLTNWAIAYE
ncbi:hypothetical protein QBE52_10065 [Clostridiaceae bacterium 35-E11]